MLNNLEGEYLFGFGAGRGHWDGLASVAVVPRGARLGFFFKKHGKGVVVGVLWFLLVVEV